jgi:hypothetical protein
MGQQPIPWKRLAAEGAAIVLSILLAFGIEAGWSQRQDRTEERELLTALRAETLLNQQILRQTAQRVEGGRGALTAFVRSTAMSDLMNDSLSKAVVIAFGRSYASGLVLGALDATINSGKLGLIRDPELRALLVQTAALEDDALELRQVATDLTTQAHLALAPYPEPAAILSSGAPLTMSLANQGLRVSLSTINEMRTDATVSALAVSKISFWTGHLVEMQVLAQHLEEVVQAIDRELSE